MAHFSDHFFTFDLKRIFFRCPLAGNCAGKAKQLGHQQGGAAPQSADRGLSPLFLGLFAADGFLGSTPALVPRNIFANGHIMTYKFAKALI